MSGLPYTLPALLPGGDAAFEPVTETWGALTYNDQHCPQAINRLLAQFKEKTLIESFLCALVDQVQDLEDAAWAFYTLANLDLATGDLLDKLGEKVGETRRGRVDDIYRRFIGVRILTNRSDGQIEELYSILRQIFGGSFVGWIDEYTPAAMTLDLQTPLDADHPASEIDLVLGRSKGGGISLHVLYTSAVLADTMLPDSTVLQFSTSGQRPGSTVSSTGGGTASVHAV